MALERVQAIDRWFLVNWLIKQDCGDLLLLGWRQRQQSERYQLEVGLRNSVSINTASLFYSLAYFDSRSSGIIYHCVL